MERQLPMKILLSFVNGGEPITLITASLRNVEDYSLWRSTGGATMYVHRS